jgi:hypothetical protein
MVTEGRQVVVGDTGLDKAPEDEVSYTVLCRRHHRARQAGPADGAAVKVPSSLR